MCHLYTSLDLFYVRSSSSVKYICFNSLGKNLSTMLPIIWIRAKSRSVLISSYSHFDVALLLLLPRSYINNNILQF